METTNLNLTIINDTTMLFPKFIETLNNNFQTIDEAIGSIINTLLIVNGEWI